MQECTEEVLEPNKTLFLCFSLCMFKIYDRVRKQFSQLQNLNLLISALFQLVSTFSIWSKFCVENGLFCCDLSCKWVTSRIGCKRCWKSALQMWNEWKEWKKGVEGVKRRTTHFWVVKFHPKMSVKVIFYSEEGEILLSKSQLSLLSEYFSTQKHVVLCLNPGTSGNSRLHLESSFDFIMTDFSKDVHKTLVTFMK